MPLAAPYALRDSPSCEEEVDLGISYSQFGQWDKIRYKVLCKHELITYIVANIFTARFRSSPGG